jgi:hypothetical protein
MARSTGTELALTVSPAVLSGKEARPITSLHPREFALAAESDDDEDVGYWALSGALATLQFT